MSAQITNVLQSSPTFRYKSLSLLWIMITILLVGFSTSFFLIKILIERDQQLNAGFIGSQLEQHLNSDLFKTTQPIHQAQLEKIFKRLNKFNEVDALTLYSLKKKIVWSTQAQRIGRHFKANAGFQKALTGAIQIRYVNIDKASLNHDARAKNYFLPWVPNLYIPVHNQHGQIAGIAEIMRIPDLFLHELVFGLIMIWGGLILSGLAYFIFSYRLFMRASNELVSCEINLEQSRRMAEVGECVSMIVHDTRNLMASIQFILERLRSDHLSTEKRHAMVDAAKKPIAMSFAMMEDLLGFVSGKKPPLQCFKHNLKQLVEENQDMLMAMLDTAGHTLEIHIPDDLLLYWDEQKMLHILVNLVRNSAEAMSEPGKVTITAARQGEGVRVLVQDSGPGIEAAVLATLFDPFVSAKGKTRPGLGLAIIRDLVRRHGGEVVARNRAEGGAEFDLYFPDCPVFSDQSSIDDVNLST